MRAYLDLIRRILDEGVDSENRTGVYTKKLGGACFEHDMAAGFPLLTTKQMPGKVVRVELEGFVNGITDKKWYQDRGCRIWDEWCNPTIVPYGLDPDAQRKMREERDLGPIYGFQWRHFGADYVGYDHNYMGQGTDQLAGVVTTLKTRPTDRRMVVSAWNPTQIHKMALPPCHYAFQVLVVGNRLDLNWNQRSVDTMLGLPFNIASYGFLLHLLAKEAGLKEGVLRGFLGDTHIYSTHFDAAREQLERKPYSLPRVETEGFTSIFNWTHKDTKVLDYMYHPRLQMEVVV